jgi:hypothetical protein
MRLNDHDLCLGADVDVRTIRRTTLFSVGGAAVSRGVVHRIWRSVTRCAENDASTGVWSARKSRPTTCR